MPALSERDLSSVEKFFNAMRAALTLTKKRRDEHAAESRQQPKPQQPLDAASQRPDRKAALATERRVWAETAFVFWRIAGRQQTHLLSYVTNDAVGALHELCDGLLDYIQESFDCVGPSAASVDVLHCAGALSADHIFFFLQAFCTVKNCMSMAGAEEAAGRQLHAHVCDVLVRRGHLQWMTRIFVAFCTEARFACEGKCGISAVFVSAVKDALRCLRQCCSESVTCARALIYTEPKPLVASLMQGLRLRIATGSPTRPFVIDDVALNSGNSAIRPEDWSRIPKGRHALAEFLINGRTNVFDEVNKEALGILVVATEKVAAFDNPAIATSLCHIIELSARAVVPATSTEAERKARLTSGSASMNTNAVPGSFSGSSIPMSTQVAMYENTLAAWGVLCSLLHSSNGCTTPQERNTRHDAVLQQIVKHDLAECVRLMLCHCTTILESDHAFLGAVNRLCTPRETRGRAPVTQQQQQQQQTRVVIGNESFLSNRSITQNSLNSSIHLTREPNGPLSGSSPHQTMKERPPAGGAPQQTKAVSLWKSFWGGGRGDTGGRPNSVAVVEEDLLGNITDTDLAATLMIHPPTDDEQEEWWYLNTSYVTIVHSIVQVLDAAFVDVGFPLSLRFSICGLLSSVTMRSSCAFSELQGRLMMRSFLRVLRFNILRVESLPSSPGYKPREQSFDSVEFSRQTIEEKVKSLSQQQQPQQQQQQIQSPRHSHSSEDEALSVLMARRIVSALWQTYHVLHEPPLSGEIVELIEIPLSLLHWEEFSIPLSSPPHHLSSSPNHSLCDANSMLRTLFASVIRLWHAALVGADDDEDCSRRSHEVLMEVLRSLLRLGTIPLSNTSNVLMGGLTAFGGAGVGAMVIGGSSGLSSTAAGVLEDNKDTGGIESTLFSENGSVTSNDGEGVHAVESPSLSEPDGIVKALQDIFTVLLQRNARFLSTAMLEVLFALLWASDTHLSRLGRRCITSSLEFGDVYAAYAEVICGAESSLLVQLLPLFYTELTSSETPTEVKHERRVWLFQHGCVNAVIGVLEHILRAPHNVNSFPALIHNLFCFLSAFQSAQGGSPQLSETRLSQVFADAVISLEGAEFFILIAQAVLNAATSKYSHGRSYSRRVLTHGHFTLPAPNFSAEKPVFLGLFPPLLRHAHEHAIELEVNLIAVIHLVLKATTNARCDELLQWVLETRRAALLPYLELDTAVVEKLPYMGSKEKLKAFWLPILSDAPERSETRFSWRGGIVVTFGQWPEKGFSISAYFRFEEIYNNMSLFEFSGTDVGGPPPASLHIVSGDSVHIIHDGKKEPVNESHALQGLSPGSWVHIVIVMSVAHTASVYFNGNKIGTCTLPYFRPYSEVIINIGFVSNPVPESLYSIGSVEMWDEELTAPQVEAHVATTGYQPSICKLLPREVPRELSDIHDAPPIGDRIARFVPYENSGMLLLNSINTPGKYPIIAKLTGNYAEPPKIWIDFQALFLSRGGLMHLLDWIGQSTNVKEFERFVSLTCDCIRGTTTHVTTDFRTYLLFVYHLRTHASLITPAVCDSLLHLAAVQKIVNDEYHPVIINRLVFDFIFTDVELLSAMSPDVAVYMIQRVERLFSVSFCRFAKRNTNYVGPFRFVDKILNCFTFAPFPLPFAIRAPLVSCIKQVMIACDFEPSVVGAVASTAAVLIPSSSVDDVSHHHHHHNNNINHQQVQIQTSPQQQRRDSKVQQLQNPHLSLSLTMRLPLPKPRFREICVSPQVASDMALLILRSLVDCCNSTSFMVTFGRIIDLHWFAVCVSHFANSACVVYATRLFFEALQVNSNLRNEAMQHPAAIVEALAPHRLNKDLMLLLLSHSFGAASRIDVLSSKHPLLEQLDGILNSMAPEPDTIVAPIFSKMLTLHLNAMMCTPACFRPYGISSVMQRRQISALRLYPLFSLSRVCARLMFFILAKRRQAQQERKLSRVSNPASPKQVRFSGFAHDDDNADVKEEREEKEDKTDGIEQKESTPPQKTEEKQERMAGLKRNDTNGLVIVMRRHRRAFLALRILVRLWMQIQRRRYRGVLRRLNVAGTANSSSPAPIFDTEADGTIFVLQSLRRLSWNPSLFVSLTHSPYQIAALAVFGTYIQKDAIAAQSEELRRAQWSIINTNVLSASIASATVVIGARVQASEDGPPLTLTPLRSQTVHATGRLSCSGSLPRGTLADDEDDDDDDDDDDDLSARSISLDNTIGSGGLGRQRQHVGEATPVSPMATYSQDRRESDEECSSDTERQLGSTVLTMNLDSDLVADHLSNTTGTLGEIHELSVSRASLSDLLRESAVDILRCTIVSALHTVPVTTGWVGGQNYGSCGALLFQVMLSSGAASGIMEDSSTLTNFFMYKVLECIEVQHNPTEKARGRRGRISLIHKGSMSDVFFFNICRFNDLLVDMLSFNVMELSSISPYFVALLAHSSIWPRRSEQQLRAQVVKSCIAALNKPSVQEVTSETMEIVYLLLTHVMCSEWIMKDMLECLLRVLFKVYTSLPPTSMDDEDATKRRNLAILSMRCMMQTYKGMKELHKALSARTLTQRFSLYKEFTTILLSDDEASVFAAFDAYCRDNINAVDALMSGRPKTKADHALKTMLKDRSEYIKRIKTFNEVYTKTTELIEEYRASELIRSYNARFSSCVGNVSPINRATLHYLTILDCSMEKPNPNLRELHYFDSRRNYATLSVPRRISGDPESSYDAEKDNSFSASNDAGGGGASHTPITPGSAKTQATVSSADGVPHVLLCADRCERQLNHITALVLPFPIRCKPFVDSQPSFIDSRCNVSPSAVSLLRFLLEPSEILRFISNGFRINGIHATPCLILLTNNRLKVIGFSRITERGDIILCQQKGELDEQNNLTCCTKKVSHSPLPKKNQQQAATFSFALNVTSKLQRLLTDDGRRKRETEERKDGTKVAQSVRQATGQSDRDLFWIYKLDNISSVLTAYYMHQDTAVLLDLAFDDGPLLSIVDSQQSMNTHARDEFLSVLREVLGNSRVEYHEHSQRSARIRTNLIRWAAGSISTFDYLSFLNRMACRTIKDFNQYPIYPWILADYKSNELALDLPETYRDLSFPMGAQTEARRQAVSKLYSQMLEVNEMESVEGGNSHVSQPFHHGTHYSTSGGVLYYLIRAEPFTTFARIFQGGDFDVATRLFDSVDASFQSCIHGPADCKELTPEFFFNAKFLLNIDKLEFGEKSDGTIVNDVKLPPWAKGSTQVFTAIMRYVLESNTVMDHINSWIDLIFGVRRRGNLAVESFNVFQRMTYGEEVVKALKESHSPHDIDVIVAEVDNFGQTPMQLFQERHPAQRELEPIAPPGSSGTGGVGGGTNSGGAYRSRSGHTYTLAFHECMPKVLHMIMHALDVPQTWYTLVDPTPGSFLSPPPNLSTAFRISESAVLGFVTMRTKWKRMCCYKHFTPVDDTDYVICWNEGEHRLMRFDASSGSFESPLRYESALKAPLSVSAIRVSRRETLVLVGSNSGTISCLTPGTEDSLTLLSVTLCHHTNPVAGFAMDEYRDRVISFTTAGTDFPIVWCVQRRVATKLHQLDISSVLPNLTPGERIVVAAFIDPQTANSVIITRRQLLLFDNNGEPFGVGMLPMNEDAAPHLEDETGQFGFAVDDGARFVASMTTVTTYDTLEWASGIQLILTGHQDGSISLWRVSRLPPDKVKHGTIAFVEHHGLIMDGGQHLRLGAVTTIQQEQRDVPTFLVGFHNGAVKVFSFADPSAEFSKTAKST